MPPCVSTARGEDRSGVQGSPGGAVRGSPGGKGHTSPAAHAGGGVEGRWRDAWWGSFWARSRVSTWGSSHRRQTGHNETLAVPHALLALDGNGVVEVSCGGYHAIARTLGGAVFCWGWGDNGQLGRGDAAMLAASGQDHVPMRVPDIKGATRVLAGQLFSACVTREGNMFCWGAGGSGQLGRGSTESSHEPQLAMGPDATGAAARREFVLDAASGHAHVLARVCGGERRGEICVAWGRNNHAQCCGGDVGRRPDCLSPEEVMGLPESRGRGAVAGVACGADFSAALVRASHGAAVAGEGGCQVWMWGHGAHGALGNGGQADQPQPVLVKALEKESIVRLACGNHHCVGVSKKGELWCWGLDASGQISKRDMGRSAAGGLGSKPQGSAASSARTSLPRPLDLSLLAPLTAPALAHGREGGGGDSGWLVACGVDHTLIGLRGAAVEKGVVALGVLSEGHGNRGIDAENGVLLPGPEAVPGEVLMSLARCVRAQLPRAGTLWRPHPRRCDVSISASASASSVCNPFASTLQCQVESRTSQSAAGSPRIGRALWSTVVLSPSLLLSFSPSLRSPSLPT